MNGTEEDEETQNVAEDEPKETPTDDDGSSE
jgi:hypothetical protein